MSFTHRVNQPISSEEIHRTSLIKALGKSNFQGLYLESTVCRFALICQTLTGRGQRHAGLRRNVAKEIDVTQLFQARCFVSLGRGRKDQTRKGKRYTTEDKIRMLREVDGGKTVLDICRERNIAEQTF